MVEATTIDGAGAVRFVLTLRDARDADYLWSERLVVTVENWFEVQQHVVRRLTTALNVHLSAERLSAIASRPPENLKAYDLWLLGQATFLSFDPKNWNKAAELFQRVVEAMPTFAPAHSSLAQLLNSNHIVLPGVFRDPRRTERALAYAREAARLDPIDSRSQLCLGWSHAMAKQYDQAMIYIPLAQELNENDPWTMVSAANCYAFCGEYQRAHELAAHALALPLAPSPLQWSYHVAVRFMEGDYEGCVAAAEAAGDVNPNVRGYKSASLFHLGKIESARKELKAFYDVVRNRWVGTVPPTEEAIARWLLRMFPIRNPEDWERLRDGLAGAGAEVRGLEHHDW